MADNTPVMILDTSCETVEKSRGIDIGRECRRLAIAVGTAIALHSSPTIAQTTPTSPSTSASATADKGVGVGQYASNGRKFEELASLSEEEFGKLPPAIRLSVRRWKNEQLNQAVVSKTNEGKELDQAVVSKTNEGKELDQAVVSKTAEKGEIDKTIIAEYQRMIDNFSELHAKKSTAPIYFTIKEDLKKVLLAGKPPEILPQLEAIRSILMS